MQFAKFWVGLVGSATTAILGVIPPAAPIWQTLTIISAVATAVGVYLVPNAPAPPAP